MKLITASCLLLQISIFAQTPPTPAATAAGTCNIANTGNQNTIHIECGIGKEQGQKVLAILNRVLAAQADSTAEILSRLDVCLGGRTVNETQAEAIRNELSRVAPQEVAITAFASSEDASSYGTEIGNAILGGRWTVTGNVVNKAIATPLDNLRGVYLLVHDQNKPPLKAIQLQRALRAAHIDATVLSDGGAGQDGVIIWIGRR